jgi:hypothetical protein
MLRQFSLHLLGVRGILAAEEDEDRAFERPEDVEQPLVGKVGGEEVFALFEVDFVLLRLPDEGEPAAVGAAGGEVEDLGPGGRDEGREVFGDVRGGGDDVRVAGDNGLAIGDGSLEDNAGEGGERGGLLKVKVGDGVLAVPFREQDGEKRSEKKKGKRWKGRKGRTTRC